jgi:predicted CoA-binding protein
MTDLSRYQDPLTIQRVLHNANTIAIVGLSSNELRASYFVGYYLKRHGYRVIPVNPRETEILGETCYPSLLDIPVPVDIVNVFRAPDALPGIAGRGGDPRRCPLVPVRRDQRRRRADR